jgi:hypothetical protein
MPDRLAAEQEGNPAPHMAGRDCRTTANTLTPDGVVNLATVLPVNTGKTVLAFF